MPIVNYFLVEGRHEDASLAALLTGSCALMADVLECPIDRVRSFAHEFRPHGVCVGGRMVSDGAEEAVYFRFVLMEGRPVEMAQRLLEGLTDLVVESLGVEQALVRGESWTCAPDRWAIAGVPASLTRQTEIDARASGHRR